jgi:Phosphoinositide 3-kinase family, accessory domain (PIK domain)
LQLVTALRYEILDESSRLANLLIEKSAEDKRMATMCYWHLTVEIENKNPIIKSWYETIKNRLTDYLSANSPVLQAAIAKQFRFRACLFDLSKELLKNHKKNDKLKAAFKKKLNDKASIRDLEGEPSDELSILDPDINITNVNPSESTVFKSNTKPFLLSFNSKFFLKSF